MKKDNKQEDVRSLQSQIRHFDRFGMTSDPGAGVTVDAIWHDSRYVAEYGALPRWYSADGDNWTLVNGERVTAPEFSRCAITFIGGPRDGETVE